MSRERLSSSKPSGRLRLEPRDRAFNVMVADRLCEAASIQLASGSFGFGDGTKYRSVLVPVLWTAEFAFVFGLKKGIASDLLARGTPRKIFGFPLVMPRTRRVRAGR